MTVFGGATTPLTSGTHYEVRDALTGKLWFPYPKDFYRIDVTYTPSPAIPSRIRMAANIMAAHWMRPILNDEVPGLSSATIGAEFSITFSQYVQEHGYPAEVDLLLSIPSLYIA